MNNGGMQNAGGMPMMGGGVSMPMNAGNVSAMPLSSGGGPQQVMMPAMMPAMGGSGAGGSGGMVPSSGGGSEESTYVFACRQFRICVSIVNQFVFWICCSINFKAHAHAPYFSCLSL